MAISALSRGAKVTLVGANLSVPIPAGVEFISANSTHEMSEVMQLRAASNDVVIMNAAVADYYVKNPTDKKIKKNTNQLNLVLEETEDILSTLGKKRTSKQYLVGFAAETVSNSDELISMATEKLTRKNVDLIIANSVSEHQGIGTDDNQAILVTHKTTINLPKSDKLTLADGIWDFIVKDLAKVA